MASAAVWYVVNLVLTVLYALMSNACRVKCVLELVCTIICAVLYK